jgi:hypothetical protein
MLTVHEMSIAVLKRRYPQAETHGFEKAVRSIIQEPIDRLGLRPDLWVRDDSNKRLTCIEVEDHSKVSPGKLSLYVRLWWWLDGEEWDFILLVADRWGNAAPIDLYAIGWVVDQSHIAERKRADT